MTAHDSMSIFCVIPPLNEKYIIYILIVFFSVVYSVLSVIVCMNSGGLYRMSVVRD
jgi:hypothetical protein